MGVAGLFAFLRRKYPEIVDACAQQPEEVAEGESTCDNLYLDLNHIIHVSLVAAAGWLRYGHAVLLLRVGMAGLVQSFRSAAALRRDDRAPLPAHAGVHPPNMEGRGACGGGGAVHGGGGLGHGRSCPFMCHIVCRTCAFGMADRMSAVAP